MLTSTGELAELAETAARDAERLLVNAQRAVRRAKAKAAELRARGEHDAAAGRRRGRLVRAVNDLAELLAATRQIVAQTRQRVAGHTPDGATRRVSLHDGDARPIAKGRLGRPVEFGHKAQIVDNDDGIVLDHSVERGNPPDAPQLAPAVKRVKKRAGRTPAHRHHRPRLRRSQRRSRAHRPRREERGDPPQRQTLPGPASRRTPASLPTNNQVAHRKRRPHQHPQAWLRLGSHPHRRHRRRPNLDRARRPDPQPGQDQCPRRVIDSAQPTLTRQTGHNPTQPLSTGAGFSGRSS